MVDNEILMRYLATFVLSKKEILEEPVTNILNSSYLKEAESLFKTDENLPDNIAALVYNVPVSMASQVTLTREIENALNNKDIERINELAKHSHFLDILKEVINRGITLETTAITIEGLDHSLFTSENDLAIVWNTLGDMQLEQPLEKQEFSDTHRALLRNVSAHKREMLVNFIVKGLRNPIEKFSGRVYYAALEKLEDFIQEHTLNVDLSAIVELKKMS